MKQNDTSHSIFLIRFSFFFCSLILQCNYEIIVEFYDSSMTYLIYLMTCLYTVSDTDHFGLYFYVYKTIFPAFQECDTHPYQFYFILTPLLLIISKNDPTCSNRVDLDDFVNTHFIYVTDPHSIEPTFLNLRKSVLRIIVKS